MDNRSVEITSPPTPDRAHQLDVANNANFLALRRQNSNAQAEKTNRTYVSEEKRFITWIKNYPDIPSLRIPPPGFPAKTISAHSINTYYLESMKLRDCTRGYAEKVHLALNKLAIREESTLAPDLLKHPDTAQVLQEVLTHIDNKWIERKKAEEHTCDPHDDNPTAIIDQEKISRVLTTKLARQSGWLDSAVVWSVTSVAAARFNSVQRLRTGKMVLIENLPPSGIKTPHDGRSWDKVKKIGDTRMIGFLIPPYDQIKRRQGGNKRQQANTECIGAYRHKRFERCVAGICAFRLLEKMNQINVSFLEGDAPDGYIKWNQIPLFENSYRTVNTSFKEAMAEAGVTAWAKVTHMRKVATTFTTAQGLSPDMVKTISKHKVEVFLQSYVCALSIPVCVCLAGFLPNDKNDTYFVPRTTIGLPGNLSIDQLSNILFPMRPKWIEQHNSPNGDKSKGAKHFLFKIIPFLSETLAQDGIFWVHKFPLNPATRELLARFEGKTGRQHYLDWAKAKRKDIEQILAQKEERELTNIMEEGGGRVSCEETISRRRENEHERAMLEKEKMQLQERESRILAREVALQGREEKLQNQYNNLIQSFLSQGYPHPPNQSAVLAQKHFLPACQQPTTMTLQTNQDERNNIVMGNVMPREGNNLGESQNLCLLRTNANDSLKPTITSVNAYCSLENLANKCQLHLHNSILSGKKMKQEDWANPKTDPNNWSRIKILYERIKDRQRETGESLKDAAIWLDTH